MSDDIKRSCPVCGQGELEPYRSCCLTVRDTPFSPVESFLEAELYLCPHCRRLEIFLPPTPAEQFQAQQERLAALSPVEQFEYRFRDYDEKQLQKVIDGRDYVPAAKKAAKTLLNRRRYES